MNEARSSDPTIAVVINTLNEARNLPRAVRSVKPWADEIVVVDMESDDGTAEIAASLGARVFNHPRLGFSEPARAFAVERAESDWILILDADELVPRTLAEQLRSLARSGEYDIVRIPWSNYLFGKMLSGTGWGMAQSYHPRFFRRGAIEFTPDIHDFMHPSPGAKILTLPADTKHAVVHFNYRDVSHFIEKLNRYTTVEADTRRASPSLLRTLLRAFREVLSRYVRHGGYRDGWRGIFLASAMAFYRLASWAKQREIEEVGSVGAIDALYDTIAERILADCESGPLGEDRAGNTLA
jgi:glycosyltransferase involved in cell wall biosynthesis